MKRVLTMAIIQAGNGAVLDAALYLNSTKKASGLLTWEAAIEAADGHPVILAPLQDWTGVLATLPANLSGHGTPEEPGAAARRNLEAGTPTELEDEPVRPLDEPPHTGSRPGYGEYAGTPPDVPVFDEGPVCRDETLNQELFRNMEETRDDTETLSSTAVEAESGDGGVAEDDNTDARPPDE